MTTLETETAMAADSSANTSLATPPPTRAELADRVAAIGDTVAAGVGYANRERHLAPEVVDAIASAELFSMFTPARFGGLGVRAHAATEVLQQLARHCGSAAWVTMITNGGNYYLSRFSEQAQLDVWESNPGARVASVTSMDCTFERCDGGWTVTGRWPFSSGITHDDWAVLGNAEVQALVPAADYTIEETWETVGMRGTGSHTTVLREVFVPSHRVTPFTDVMGYGMCTDPATPAALRMLPLEVSGLIIASVVVGLGTRACELVADVSQKRMMPMAPYAKAADSPVFRERFGECEFRMENARLHLASAAEVIDAAADAAAVPSDRTLVHLRANVAHAVRSVTLALDDLMYLAGASAFASASPIQQVWRDANTGARHAVTNAFVSYEWLGHLAVDPDATAFKP